MTTKEVKPGTHFWGIISDKMAVFFKDSENDIYICGGWEMTIVEERIEFVSIIENPMPNIETYYK
jgi:glutamine synthetase type III